MIGGTRRPWDDGDGTRSLTLAALGPRICVLGPSNSGKSTLAVAIGRARRLPPVHLDQLYHLPETDWQPRPTEAFVALHDAAIAAEHWVMDGNYSRCFPQRLARATGVILLDVSTATSLFRYLRRSRFQRDRAGALPGGQDSVKWEMIRHILVATPRNRRRYRAMFEALDVPKLSLPSSRRIARFYAAQGLTR